MRDHPGNDALGPVGVVLLHGVLRRASGVAVRHAGAVLEGGIGVGVAGCLKLLLEQVDGVVEEVGVSIANCEMQFALKLRAKRRPIALENGGKVVMLMPVSNN